MDMILSLSNFIFSVYNDITEEPTFIYHLSPLTEILFFPLSFFRAEGEDVEYDIVVDSSKGDKRSAANVTGPDGGNVIGTPRRDAQPRSRRDDNDDRY